MAASSRLRNLLIELHGACPYAVLGITRNKANAKQIKSKFRGLVFEWHPDKFLASSPALQEIARAKFRQIRAAHDVLSDHSMRNEFDSWNAHGYRITEFEKTHNTTSSQNHTFSQFDPNNPDSYEHFTYANYKPNSNGPFTTNSQYTGSSSKTSNFTFATGVVAFATFGMILQLWRTISLRESAREALDAEDDRNAAFLATARKNAVGRSPEEFHRQLAVHSDKIKRYRARFTANAKEERNDV